MGTAAQHVLALPELLSTILQHVHDDQPLLNCMLVNSLWEYESTTIQWTEVGELPLENVHPERQQYYADKVRKCSVPIVDVEDGANTTLSLVKHRSLVFPRLKSVKVIGNVSGWRLSVWRLPVICDASFDPLFPSTLQNIELELPTMDCFPPLLELIAKRCNQVTKVTIAHWSQGWYRSPGPLRLDSYPALLSSFNDLSSIKHLDIARLGYFFPSDYLLQVFHYSQLQSLGLEIRFASLSQWNAFESRLQPSQFANLRSLNISSSIWVLIRMCHVVPILTSLEMTCCNGVEGTLPERQQMADLLFDAITHFSELRTLKVCVIPIPPEHFLLGGHQYGPYGSRRNRTQLPITASLLESIATYHPHLEILHFTLGNIGDIEWGVENLPSFTDVNLEDSDMEQLARKLPQLSSFEFCTTRDFKSKLSAASLVALGTHCRALTHILFMPNVDLRALDHLRERPLFPNLTNLDISFYETFRPTEGTSPAIAFLDFHCPKLQTIGGHHMALVRRPWELASIFTDGPSYLNGFNLSYFQWADGYGNWAGGMVHELPSPFYESEPSVWGNELFESDEASTDEDEESCSCSGSECGSNCTLGWYDSSYEDRRRYS